MKIILNAEKNSGRFQIDLNQEIYAFFESIRESFNWIDAGIFRKEIPAEFVPKISYAARYMEFFEGVEECYLSLYYFREKDTFVLMFFGAYCFFSSEGLKNKFDELYFVS